MPAAAFAHPLSLGSSTIRESEQFSRGLECSRHVEAERLCSDAGTEPENSLLLRFLLRASRSPLLVRSV
eukprot:5474881-Pleurochrysis_carterae.AAC.4